MKRSEYVIRGGLPGRERLKVLARIMRPTTINLFERIKLHPGMACLDVGCGGGDVTFEIARIVGSGGRVVGVDIDETKLELACREAVELKFPSIEFRLSEVGQIQAEAEFDFVYARFLLTHLTDPGAAVRRMLTALRVGGVVAVEDIDFRGHFCYPDNLSFRRYVELYTQVVQRTGADPYIGPRLPSILLDCGCQNVQMNVVQPTGIEGEIKRMAPLTMENIADSVLAHGLALRQEIDQVINDLYVVAEDHRTVMSLPRVIQAWGYRGV